MMSSGKRIAHYTYLHVDSVRDTDRQLYPQLIRAAKLAELKVGSDFNVVKFGDMDTVSLLDYPRFLEDGFPILQRNWTVDLVNNTIRFRSFKDSQNPPILHRKELLLPEDHPYIIRFRALTQNAEQAGLFDDTSIIGFKKEWNILLTKRGYKVVGNELIPIGNEESDLFEDAADRSLGVARHLTAIYRTNLSAPVQSLVRLGFLDGTRSVFDYGCGRGGDVRALKENGIAVEGWDPYYAPNQPKCAAEIVNIGFVINVIENKNERIEALLGAFELATELLVVSAMIANPEMVKGRAYGDGVITSRNTFQKYYTQAELRVWLCEVLCKDPIAVGPGIFYIFKNSALEQQFQIERQSNRRNFLIYSSLTRPYLKSQVHKAEALYRDNKAVLDDLWDTRLRLARIPDKREVREVEAINAAFGNIQSAIRFIQSLKEIDEAILDTLRVSRIDDLKVYFADVYFHGRLPYKHLEAGLQRDVKAFFGDYQNALYSGRELLLMSAKPEILEEACRLASENGLGWMEDSHSLQLHTSLVPQLPPLLRVYINCGLRLYGDVSSADLIKIHILSGKLTLMSFDDFDGRPLPKLMQRVKIKLREQDLEVYEYGNEFDPPYLYRKSRYINEELLNYAEQLAFDEALAELDIIDEKGYGPRPAEFDAKLASLRYTIEGFQLVRSKDIPDLDSPCGKYLKYRDLIECGETQINTGLSNLPKEAKSYTALFELVRHVLDPVIDYYGMIRLTYGFCSPTLGRQIKGRIAPKLDQHASYEFNRLGRPICERLGAAADFIVDDENMIEVAAWISENIAFDRMYIYGSSRPLHISHSDVPLGQICIMLPSSCADRLIPKIITKENLLSMIVKC